MKKILKKTAYISLCLLLSLCVWKYIEDQLISSNSQIQEKDQFLPVPLLQQNPLLPNGCEATSAVMVLQYYGIDISCEGFVDSYLPMEDVYTTDTGWIGPDPNRAYAGDPYSQTNGFGCYAPVITAAMQKVCGTQWQVEDISGTVFAELENWLEQDIPVILWATVNMKEISSWCMWNSHDGTRVYYPAQEHCLVLIGMDEEYCYFNDPLKKETSVYPREQCEKRYQNLGEQAVVMYLNQ